MIIFEILIIFLAGLTKGLTSFGLALVSVPLLVILISPKIVVPLILIYDAMTNMIILLASRKWVEIKRIWPLMITGIIGIPFGTYPLMVLDIRTYKVFIGFIITLFATAFLMGFNRKIKNEKLSFATIGFLSGLLSGSTAMSGPPIILFFTNQGVAKHPFRANVVAYFIVLDLATLIAFTISGLMTKEVINYAILLIPGLIIGAFTGMKLVHKVDEKLFRNITLLVVTVAGLVSIASGLGLF
jgi:uncharacterized membrane protein YfcA